MSISHFRVLCVLVILCAACGPATETPVPTFRVQTVTSTPAALYTPSLTLAASTAPPASPFQLDGLEGWCWQDILGLVDALNDVFFLDRQTGWAVGEGGIILHTQDSGVTWQRQISPVRENFHRVFFVDAHRGWIAGRGVLLHTEDGGRVWVEHPLLSGVNSWESVDFAWADAHTGWLIFSEHIFHTFDGGQTWQEQSQSSDWLLENIVCLDDRHAWITSGDTILRTTDGGLTWSSHNYGPGYYFSAFTFTNEHLGWAVSFDHILHTVDGGQTWYVQHETENVYGLADVFFLNENTGWAVSPSGQLWFTDDGGMIWEDRDIPPLRRAIFFVDAQEGWAVGNWQDGERATIMHTRDRGTTWQIQDTFIEMPASAYTASSRLTNYIAEETPLTEALVVRLVPGPCSYTEGYLITEALYSLGWNGKVWRNSSPSSSDYVMDTIERFDADVDRDGVVKCRP